MLNLFALLMVIAVFLGGPLLFLYLAVSVIRRAWKDE